ncbi:MAG: hypothetical protein IKL04_00725 [Lachnospiraceae bacterium]|nr:hypothetical protein [Lachnospiraceae bacterium]
MYQSTCHKTVGTTCDAALNLTAQVRSFILQTLGEVDGITLYITVSDKTPAVVKGSG